MSFSLRTVLLPGWLRAWRRRLWLLRLAARRRRHGVAAVCQATARAIDPRRVIVWGGARVGTGTVVYPGLRVVGEALPDFSGLTIGRDAHIGRQTTLDLTEAITIDDLAVVGMRALIATHDDTGSGSGGRRGPVRIGHGSSLGACVTILPGVRVGDGSFIGGGALVTRDVPDGVVVAGAPARVVRRLARVEGR